MVVMLSDVYVCTCRHSPCMLPVFWFTHSCQTTEALHALCNWNMITRFNDPLPITLKVIAMQPNLRLLQMLNC